VGFGSGAGAKSVEIGGRRVVAMDRSGPSHQGAPHVGALFFRVKTLDFAHFPRALGALFSFSTLERVGSAAKVKTDPLPPFTMNRHFS